MSIPITKFGELEKEITELEEEAVPLPFIVDNFLGKTGGEVTGVIDMTGQPIKNLPDPVDGQDAATKNYIDSSQGHSFFRRLPGRGYAAVKDLDMNENRLLNLGMPTDNREAANKLYTDITANDVKQSLEGHNPFYLNTDKHKARGDIDMLNFKIEGVPMPIEDKDASNKIYTDTLVENRRRQLEAQNPFNLDGGDYAAKNKINMNGFKIENVGFPDLPEDVATVGYVEEASVWERKNGGFVAKDHIYLGKKKLGGLREPTSKGEACNKEFVDKELKKVSDNTLKKGNDGFYSAETNLNLNNFRLFGVPDPTREDEVSNMKYVNEKIANIQPAAAGVDPAELDKIKTDLEKNQAFNTRNQKTFNARGNINMKQKSIRNIPDPVEITDAVPLGFVNEMKEFFEDRIKEVEDEVKEAKDAVDRVSRLQPGGGANNGNGNSADFGDMKGKKLINIGDPENPGDGANQKYVDQKTPFTKTNGYYTTSHGINMDLKKITNLGAPTAEGDAVNRKYLNDEINNIETGLVRRNGGFMALDAIDMNSNRIKNVGAPQFKDDAVNKEYADSKDLKAFEREGEYIKSKQTILMDGKTIEQLGDPNFLTDAVNKGYIDKKLETIPFSKVNGHFIATSSLDMGVKRITNLALPVDEDDATSRNYVNEKIKLVEEKAKTNSEEIVKLKAEDGKRKTETDRIRVLLNDKIKDVEEKVEEKEEELRKYADTVGGFYLSPNGDYWAKGQINMLNKPIKNLGFLDQDDEATPKKYVIQEIEKKVKPVEDQTKTNSENIEELKTEEGKRKEETNQIRVLLNEVKENLEETIDDYHFRAVDKVKEEAKKILSKERLFKMLGTSIILIRAEAKGPIIGIDEVRNSNNRRPSPVTPGGFIALDDEGKIIQPTILYFGRFDGGEDLKYPRMIIPTPFRINKYGLIFEGEKSESFNMVIETDWDHSIADRTIKKEKFFSTPLIENNKMYCDFLRGDSLSHSSCNSLFLYFDLSYPTITRFSITFVCTLHLPEFEERFLPSVSLKKIFSDIH